MENMRKLATPFKGQAFEAELKFKDADTAQKVEILFTKAGATVEAAGETLKVNGDLGQVMFAAIDDSDAMFNNQGDKIKAKYDFDPKVVLRAWWTAFKELDRDLKHAEEFPGGQGHYRKSMKRSIEPAYNFFGIVPRSREG